MIKHINIHYYLYLSMQPNRIKHFITNFSLNKTLNREKFIQNKKNYTILTAKNEVKNKSYYNYIVKRNLRTQNIKIDHVKQPNHRPNLLLFILFATGVYIIDNKIN
jgi:hypothetical protein